jgi:hypothetical protein
MQLASWHIDSLLLNLCRAVSSVPGGISKNDRLRIRVFGELAGMGEGEYSWVVVDCMMDLIRQLFGNTKAIHDKLNKEESLIPFDHVLRSM